MLLDFDLDLVDGGASVDRPRHEALLLLHCPDPLHPGSSSIKAGGRVVRVVGTAVHADVIEVLALADAHLMRLSHGQVLLDSRAHESHAITGVVIRRTGTETSRRLAV